MKGILNKALVITLVFSQVHQASAMSNLVVKPFQAQVIAKVGQLARQAGKSAFAKKTGALVAKYPEHAILGGAVTTTGVGVAVSVKYAADKKAQALASLAKPSFSQWLASTGALQSAKRAGSWLATTSIAQSMCKRPEVWVAGAAWASVAACWWYTLRQKSLRESARATDASAKFSIEASPELTVALTDLMRDADDLVSLAQYLTRDLSWQHVLCRDFDGSKTPFKRVQKMLRLKHSREYSALFGAANAFDSALLDDPQDEGALREKAQILKAVIRSLFQPAQHYGWLA